VEAQLEELRSGKPDKFYPLWKLGLLGNRGVEPDAAFRALTDHLTDPNAVTRRWAVNGLGMLGTDAAIEPLAGVFRNDTEPEIRERAACQLADSGMFTREQRWKALPHLLPMMDDPKLDAQTRGWVFQALREISGASIAGDAAAWRNWWANEGASKY
jgi:HEAT repeat protein